jgi:hypothetical protein
VVVTGALSKYNLHIEDQKEEKLIQELANHKAFSATNGVDDEWPIWYAGYLLDKMRMMLNSTFTKSELIYVLMSEEKENGLVTPGVYWPRFYANFIASRYT